MILDLQTVFSGTVAADGTKTGQAITTTAAISTNVIDRAGNLTLFPTLGDEGLSGPETWLVVQAQTAANGADSAKTLTISLLSDSNPNMVTSPVTHASSAAILGSAITLGATLWRIQLPSDNYKRYLGLNYAVSATFTSWNVLAFITPDLQRNVTYPTGFAVL